MHPSYSSATLHITFQRGSDPLQRETFEVIFFHVHACCCVLLWYASAVRA